MDDPKGEGRRWKISFGIGGTKERRSEENAIFVLAEGKEALRQRRTKRQKKAPR